MATDDLATTDGGSSVEIAVLYNDIDLDNDSLAIKEVTQGTHGVVEITLNNTLLEYTPIDPDYAGIDSFEYTVTDYKGGEDTGTVTVNIIAKPDPPTIEITYPTENEVIMGDALDVEFTVTNCNFTPPSEDSNGCHAHRYLDGVKWSPAGQYAYEPFTLGPIEPGEHVFTLRLIKNDGSDAGWSPQIQDEVVFTLEEEVEDEAGEEGGEGSEG